MHDTFLLTKISKALKEICVTNKINKINQLSLVVNYNSHINGKSLKEYLEQHNKEMLGDEFKIIIQNEDIEDQTAIIHNIQGETIKVK